MWKLNYERECENYNGNIEINVWGGMWKLMCDGECEN
jgi:hypothetical protein